MLITVVLVVFALIAINALYVAAELSAVALRPGQLRELGPSADYLRGVIADPRLLDRYIAASQVGITLSSLILGAYAEAQLAPRIARLLERGFDMSEVAAVSTAVGLVLLVLTALQVLFGELVPKSLALQKPLKIAVMTSWSMRQSVRLFAWFIALLNGSAIVFLRLFGIRPKENRHVHTPEEIGILIAESQQGGLIEPEDRERLETALTLGERSIRELMVPREEIVALDLTGSPAGALAGLAKSPYTRVPAHQGTLDQTIGMIHTKDLVASYLLRGHAIELQKLVRPLLRVSDQLSAAQLLALLREKRTQQALVVDATGTTVGLVTLDDILTEMLGEVSDEFKGESGGPVA